MIAFVFGTLALIVCIVFVCLNKKKKPNKSDSEYERERHATKEAYKKKVRAAWLLGVFVSVLIIASSFVSVVPTGYTGVLTSFGRVDDRRVESGLNIVKPWQSVVKMDNRTQKTSMTFSAFSSDIQQVDTQLSVNYNIDSSTAHELYRTVGTEYFTTIVQPRILENTKAVFSKYSAENLVANRDSLSDSIMELLTNDMSPYGIFITSIAIEDIDFTDVFTNAVEAKQVAAQNKLTAQTEQDKLTMEQNARAEREIIAAEAEARKAVIAANSELEVVKIQADAATYAGEKEAERNRRIAESITPELIEYYGVTGAVEAWANGGDMPEYLSIGGGTTTPVIDFRGNE